MIVLDTNVVSEPMKPDGNPIVRAWLDRQVAGTLHLTSTSLAELLAGIEILPDGKRKDHNSALMQAMEFLVCADERFDQLGIELGARARL
jgi:predicted nucleic acid-binding protein